MPRDPREHGLAIKLQSAQRKNKLLGLVTFSVVLFSSLHLGNEIWDLNLNSNKPRLPPPSVVVLPTARQQQNNLIPLPQLTRANEVVSCDNGMIPRTSVINNDNKIADWNNLPDGKKRKIPKIIHQTGETKCLTKPFWDATEKWITSHNDEEGYSYYFHDKKARRALLSQYRPEFPQLQLAFQCLQHVGGAAETDLWRYVLLWEYGGIYTDLDNVMGPLYNAKIVTDQMDGFFLQSGPGFPQQFHFGVSPKHPIMYLAVQDALKALLDLQDIGHWYVPTTTGPSCLHHATLKFLGVRGEDRYCNNDCTECCKWPPPGHHVGLQGSGLVTILPTSRLLRPSC